MLRCSEIAVVPERPQVQQRGDQEHAVYERVLALDLHHAIKERGQSRLARLVQSAVAVRGELDLLFDLRGEVARRFFQDHDVAI